MRGEEGRGGAGRILKFISSMETMRAGIVNRKNKNKSVKYFLESIRDVFEFVFKNSFNIDVYAHTIVPA